MGDNSIYKKEIAQLKSQVAALEQLLEAHQQTALVQSDRLEQSLATLTKRAAEYAVLGKVSLAVLGQSDPLHVYQMVTQALVDHFNMAFARIWVLEESSNELVLQVNAGEYTHLDDPHSRVSLASRHKLARIANGREPDITNDLLNDTWVNNKKWVKERNMVASAGYPLIAGDNLLGVLDLFSQEPIARETVPLLQSLAMLVGTTVNTQRLLKQLETQARELETIAQVSTQATAALNPTQLLQTVADLTKEQFDLYHAHIYLLDESPFIEDEDRKWVLTLAAGAGEVGRQMVAEEWSIPLQQEQSLVARAARTRHGVMVNNVRQAPDWLPNPLLPNTCSELAAPMIVGDRVLGVLDVQADVINRFTDEDVRLKTILAAQVAVALQNALLFAEQQQTSFLLSERVKELNCLSDIGREIAETPSVPAFLQWVTERIPAAMQYPNLCRVAIELDGQVYGRSEAMEIPAQIVHALRVGNEVVGRVYIAYTKKIDFINEESMLLGGVANRISSYIESHHLFGRVRHQADRERLVNTISQKIQSTTTVESALQTAIRELGQAFKARYTWVELTTDRKTAQNKTGINGPDGG